ncbi:Xaa-Pro aminopeptidase [Natronocella acetinitrilica]|uniref:Xaa-Pro aminopeptidase n=1 Tax=Natronocella acetinitrilica TaxID=414046 RepID=A0AAE3G5X3_9GAMM|nr:Xaa-Pro peptidase family protein [Natronocella acetinitrilica]MCP1675713.1 Xaa-Pro aminopeptidase [Natronocella acetinitrilica]
MDHNTYRLHLESAANGAECLLPEAERLQRLENLRAGMAGRDLDAVLLTDPADIHYFSGYTTFEVSVYAGLLVTAVRCTLQVPSIEMGPAVITARCDEIIGYYWEEPESVTGPLLELLSGHGKLALDLWAPGLRAGLALQLEQQLGAKSLQPLGDLVDRLRLIKSEYEIGLLRKSADLTGVGMAAATEASRSDVTEHQIAAVASHAMLAAGSEFMSLQPIVTSGPRSGVIHLNHSDRVIQPNESVFIEIGAVYRRYTAPMMRTVLTGPPSADMQRTRDCCAELQDVLCAHMRPGNRFDEAAHAAEEVLAPLADEIFFSGVFGYAVGAQFPPSWVESTGFIARKQTQWFAPGMVFHLPLCLRRPGHWGIGLSNTVLVGERETLPLTDNGFDLPVHA